MECLILICSLAAAPNAAIVRGRQCENQKIPSVVKNKDMYRKTGTQTFPSLPKAITSFGAVRIGDWLYAYGGHYGKPHHYSQAGQSDQLQRLHLKSKTKWELHGTWWLAWITSSSLTSSMTTASTSLQCSM